MLLLFLSKINKIYIWQVQDQFILFYGYTSSVWYRSVQKILPSINLDKNMYYNLCYVLGTMFILDPPVSFVYCRVGKVIYQVSDVFWESAEKEIAVISFSPVLMSNSRCQVILLLFPEISTASSSIERLTTWEIIRIRYTMLVSQAAVSTRKKRKYKCCT